MLRRQKRLTRQEDKRPDSSPETRLEFIVLHVVYVDGRSSEKIWNILVRDRRTLLQRTLHNLECVAPLRANGCSRFA